MTERDVVRALAAVYMDIASLKKNKTLIEEWKNLNSLKPTRPMIWAKEFPWNEMNNSGELTLVCNDAICRSIEDYFRKTIYLFDHVHADYVATPKFYVPIIYTNTRQGLVEDFDKITTDEENPIISRSYHGQIKNEADLDKIKMPTITVDRDKTIENFERVKELIGDIIPCELAGEFTCWYAPWDYLVQFWNPTDLLIDIIDKPDLVHGAIRKFTDSWLKSLDLMDENNLLSFGEGNYGVGSGGLGFTDELPGENYDPKHVHPKNQWGSSTSQIFSDISPRQHYEFALQYEIEWLSRFGLTYYGCCEPLHDKIDIVRKIPNLRKISMSAWANVEKMVDRVHGDYVLSFKPNPALLAGDSFNCEQAKEYISDMLDKVGDHPLEIIFKDISTLRNDPERLFEFIDITKELIEERYE
ncbi:MAG: hypothetical protein IJS60_00370 [Abditibacteriota bacterium]|nr:hypothetical protein [Abditibacteriota bacterium]